MRDTERVHDEVRVEYHSGTNVTSLVMERGDNPINSFTPSKVEAMCGALEELGGGADCLILRGEDEFSVGANLGAVRSVPKAMRAAQIDNIAAASNRFIRALRNFSAPVVAAVAGVAAGGGLGFALSCDLIVMHEDAVLDTAYARIGLTPDNATPYYLTNALGPYRARELMFDPEPISASEARSLGIVSEVYDGSSSTFREKVFDRAVTLSEGPTRVYALTKELTDTALDGDLDSHLERERETIKSVSDSELFDEGLTAFFEKREPDWK